MFEFKIHSPPSKQGQVLRIRNLSVHFKAIWEMGNLIRNYTLFCYSLTTLIAAFNSEIFYLERFVWDSEETVQLVI